MNFTDRCAIAAACLPKADYRTQLEKLHAEMLAELEAREVVAWQWLDTAIFRRNIPATSNAAEWRPLYAAMKDAP